jgi:hypothetical protein
MHYVGFAIFVLGGVIVAGVVYLVMTRRPPSSASGGDEGE